MRLLKTTTDRNESENLFSGIGNIISGIFKNSKNELFSFSVIDVKKCCKFDVILTHFLELESKTSLYTLYMISFNF